MQERLSRKKKLLWAFGAALAAAIISLYVPEFWPGAKISAHEHYRAGGGMDSYLKAARFANIKKAVFLPTDWPASNPAYKENLQELLKLKKQYPDKIIAFATAYNRDPSAASYLEEALRNGASGIKFIDWLESKKYPNEAGAVDSANMYKIYEVARKYKVPLLMHIDFQKRPEWKEQFWNAARDFPDVTFILAHYCRAASGEVPLLELCSETLDKFPNVFTDLSMGGGIKRYVRYFDKNPEIFRNFILRYQDRILWGTDLEIRPDKPKTSLTVARRMWLDFLILQKKYYLNPFHGGFKLHRGFNLPREVLEKIYWENPKKILKL